MAFTLTIFSVILLVVGIGASQAQSLKKGTLSGEVVTASVTAAPGTSPTVITAPPTGAYIVTQAFQIGGCGSINASGFGRVPVVLPDGTGEFSPGLALPPNSTVTCDNPGCGPGTPPSVQCILTGVQTTK
jgi:hypothetical protein